MITTPPVLGVGIAGQQLSNGGADLEELAIVEITVR
jgi:hypothetical protein